MKSFYEFSQRLDEIAGGDPSPSGGVPDWRKSLNFSQVPKEVDYAKQQKMDTVQQNPKMLRMFVDRMFAKVAPKISDEAMPEFKEELLMLMDKYANLG